MANLDSAQWNGAADAACADGGASENCARAGGRRRFVVAAGERGAKPAAFEAAADGVALPACDQPTVVVGRKAPRARMRGDVRRHGVDARRLNRRLNGRLKRVLDRRAADGAQNGETLDDHDRPR
ncbi:MULTISPECIES: hypothetical protein [unclassified Lysobacter]|uniref:hypothetical protein n=1 Tax=unclassified Lysobacter TaxID=2635362 RepID=UPI001BEA0582|nr:MULTISPECIES: hypothetical protein [unclassified Lysobacter]MBT2749123.1 hypothetical protein [Lysobacter sp. ISL-42]MBT2754216.1 hypothetical protein [Lysobacter sp. ISL-50]MBT2779568.1 hypothetical protein [Lysobacter sp. ISL-54]MBT2784335.1 hypothetical protein [Lysobacter sp. ISL-52]